MLQLLLGLWLGLFPQATGLVQGTVIRGGSSEPVGGVELTLRLSNRPESLRVISDTQGRFLLPDLPAGHYVLQARREGYFTYPDSRVLPSVVKSFSLSPGQTLQIVVPLVPGAVFSGRISDPAGNPLEGIAVSVMKLTYRDGIKAFGVGSLPQKTNSQGEYRLLWFSPGEYYIRAESKGAGNIARRSYYPGTLDALAAVTQTVRGGETFDRLDFSLPLMKTIRISGSVDFGTADPAGGVIHTFYLLPLDGRPMELYPFEFHNLVEPALGEVAGAFVLEVSGIQPGAYDLAPFYIDREGEYHTGRAQLTLGDRDLADVRVSIQSNVNVTGRFRMEGSTDPPNWNAALELQLRKRGPAIPLTTRTSSAKINPDGTFTISGVIGGEYQIYVGSRSASIRSDLYISGIRQAGSDLRNSGQITVRESMLPLELAVSAGAGAIHGVVERTETGFAANAHVVLVPEFARRENLMFYDETITDDDGEFALKGVPPGAYKVFAFEQLEDSEHQSAEFITRYETLGTEVTVTPGSSTGLRVRLLR